MLNDRSTFILKMKDRKGQVALFVALIFQVLFLFFAMVINVGLLVHHKINLQNSVDLAAYYGASKQAEDLNAIAHMNYQIRQSYKLLAWRYRMLGSAGEFKYHPYQKAQRQLVDALAIESAGADGTPNGNFLEAPAFCVAYYPFKEVPQGENTCRDMADLSGIQVFGTPKVFGFVSISGTVASMATNLRARAMERCKIFGSFNYMLLAKFVVAYNNDQRDRMLIINALSESMSKSKDDFFDLNGDSVKTGMENTFKNNLTAPNRDSIVGWATYNSLGDPKCGTTGNKDRPVKWLTPIKIYPGFSYIDTQCDNHGSAGGRIQPSAKELTPDEPQPGKGFPLHMAETGLEAGIRELGQFIGYRSNLSDTYNFSLGVEKNPWCMAYVGVSATTQPKIPFTPFGLIKLKAQSFFKPFGGRIGPWYQKGWTRSEQDDQRSNTGDRVDPLAAPRATDLASLQGTMNDIQNKKLRATNYSRYVGDPIGLKSAQMVGYYGKSIYELSPTWNALGNVAPPAGNSYDVDTSGSEPPTYSDWDDLPFKFSQSGGTGDILAWKHGNSGGAPSRMRTLEMSAVAPNTFDATYYSIEPDFYNNYYLPMKKGFMAKVASGLMNNFRPDIGYHAGFKAGALNLSNYSVKDQIAEIRTQEAETVIKPPMLSKLSFEIEQWPHLLTGWIGRSLRDYSLDTSRFGNCGSSAGSGKYTGEPVAGVPNPGNCVVGGSTGYSVKMISSDSFTKEQNLGGDGVAPGLILNPPKDF